MKWRCKECGMKIQSSKKPIEHGKTRLTFYPDKPQQNIMCKGELENEDYFPKEKEGVD